MKMDEKKMKQMGRPKKKMVEAVDNVSKQDIIDFKTIRQYITDMDFTKHYGHYVERQDILNTADKKDIPENIFGLLQQLPDKYYHYYSEIRDELRKIQNPPEPEPEETQIDRLEKDLIEQTKVCEDRGNRISNLEYYFKLRNFFVLTGFCWFLISLPMALYLIFFGIIPLSSNGAISSSPLSIQILSWFGFITWITLMCIGYFITAIVFYPDGD